MRRIGIFPRPLLIGLLIFVGGLGLLLIDPGWQEFWSYGLTPIQIFGLISLSAAIASFGATYLEKMLERGERVMEALPDAEQERAKKVGRKSVFIATLATAITLYVLVISRGLEWLGVPYNSLIVLLAVITMVWTSYIYIIVLAIRVIDNYLSNN